MKREIIPGNPLVFTLHETKLLVDQLQLMRKFNGKADKESKRHFADAKAEVSDILGEAIWQHVMLEMRIPDEKEKGKIIKAISETMIFEHCSDADKAILREHLEACLNSLVNLQHEVLAAVNAVQSVLPVTAQSLREVGEKLRIETGNAIHQKWQADFRSGGGTERFKPCLTEGDKAHDEKLYAILRDEKQGGDYLSAVYAELKSSEPFDVFYRYDKEEKIWKENILRLDNAQLQFSNSRENTAAANVAVSLLVDFLPKCFGKEVSTAAITAWLLKEAGPETHRQWGTRNKSWRECQKNSFDQLPALEAIRDFQVLTAIKVISCHPKFVNEPMKHEVKLPGVKR